MGWYFLDARGTRGSVWRRNPNTDADTNANTDCNAHTDPRAGRVCLGGRLDASRRHTGR